MGKWRGVWFGVFAGIAVAGVGMIWPTAVLGRFLMALGLAGALTVLFHAVLKPRVSYVLGAVTFLVLVLFLERDTTSKFHPGGQHPAAAAVSAHVTFSVANGGEYTIPTPDGRRWAKVRLSYSGPGHSICRVYLTGLAKDGIQILSGVEYLLHAEYSGDDGLQNYNFQDGASHYYNLAYIWPKTNALTVHSDQYSSNYLNKPVLSPALYRFNIKTEGAGGETCPPAVAEIWLRYGGKDNEVFLLDRFKQRN